MTEIDVRKRTFVDTETTGLIHFVNGVHSIAIFAETEDGRTGQFRSKVRPFTGELPCPVCKGKLATNPPPEGHIFGCYLCRDSGMLLDLVNPEAMEISGTTKEELDTFPSPHDVVDQIKKFLRAYVNPFNKEDKAFWYGFSARFDQDFLRSLFAKCGDDYFGSWWWTPPIDIASLAAEAMEKVRPSMLNAKLVTVCGQAGLTVDPGEAHDAMYDTKLCRRLHRVVRPERGAAQCPTSE